MIDTDKYEGHTEGKWRVSARKGTFTVKKGEYEVAAVNDYPNARLIADAPLLLEEVKRLRKRQETMMHWLLKTKDSEWEDKEYVLTRIDEGYDLDTMIEIYEARVDMFGCSIEDDILDTLKELIE